MADDGYFSKRWEYFSECKKHSKGNWIVASVWVLSGAWSLVTTFGPLVDFPLSDAIATIPKLAPLWVPIVVLIGLVFVLVEGGHRLRQTESRRFTSQIEELQASIANANQWDDMAVQFGSLSTSIAAYYIVDGPKKWRVKGDTLGDKQGCEARMRKCGVMLNYSSSFKHNHSDILLEPDDLGRWIEALVKIVEHEKAPVTTNMENNKIYQERGIHNVANASKVLCLKLSAMQHST